MLRGGCFSHCPRAMCWKNECTSQRLPLGEFPFLKSGCPVEAMTPNPTSGWVGPPNVKYLEGNLKYLLGNNKVESRRGPLLCGHWELPSDL